MLMAAIAGLGVMRLFISFLELSLVNFLLHFPSKYLCECCNQKEKEKPQCIVKQKWIFYLKARRKLERERHLLACFA